jgi:two-component system, LytTR family, sensor kinase
VRFEDRLELDIVAGEDARRALVPAFFLQPLVENAVRHGLAPVRGGCVTVRAQVDGGELHVEVVDNGQSQDAARPAREGVGLYLNTRDPRPVTPEVAGSKPRRPRQ